MRSAVAVRGEMSRERVRRSTLARDTVVSRGGLDVQSHKVKLDTIDVDKFVACATWRPQPKKNGASGSSALPTINFCQRREELTVARERGRGSKGTRSKGICMGMLPIYPLCETGRSQSNGTNGRDGCQKPYGAHGPQVRSQLDQSSGKE